MTRDDAAPRVTRPHQYDARILTWALPYRRSRSVDCRSGIRTTVGPSAEIFSITHRPAPHPATAGIGLGVAASVLASAAVATAAPNHVAEQSQANVAFAFQQPARSTASVALESGLSGITNQAAIGSSMLALDTSPDGFAVTSNAANSGEDLLTGDATPGMPIVGSATLPAGTTMTVSVNGGPKQAIGNGAFSIQVPAQVGATHLPTSGAPTPYSSVTATPGIVRPGGRVTISGNAPKNARAGKWITLTSDAFASKRSVNGIPAIRAQVLVNGKYSVKATIRSGLKPTTYAVSGSFNGRSLDTVAWMTVRGH